MASKAKTPWAHARPSGPSDYEFHSGHTFMATVLRLVGTIPSVERRGFVRGICSVLAKWLTDNHDRSRTRWPLPPGQDGATRPGRRKVR